MSDEHPPVVYEVADWIDKWCTGGTENDVPCAAMIVKHVVEPLASHRDNLRMTNDALIAAAQALVDEWKRYAEDPDLTTPHWITPYIRALDEALPSSDESES